MKKINLFLVGAQRSGSTSLYNYLKNNSNIFLCNPKEPHYFSTDLYQDCVKFIENDKKKMKALNSYFKYVKFDEYIKLFDGNDNEKYSMDASADYLISKEAAKNINNYNPSSKIIILLRNPVDQLYSWHLHLQNTFQHFNEDFENTYSQSIYREKGKMPYPDSIRRPSAVNYHTVLKLYEQVKRYTDLFNSNQIKVILFDDIVQNPEKVMKELIEDFLDLTYVKNGDYRAHNSYKVVKNYYLKKILSNDYLHIALKPFKKLSPRLLAKTREVLYQNFVFKKKCKKIDLDEEFRQKIMKDVKDNIVKLESLLKETGLLDKDINLIKKWEYDKL